MYILGISGSPRKRGLSAGLLDSALQGARSEGAHVEKLILNELDIKPCQDCGGCSETGVCVICDDMQKVRAEIAQADGVIVVSPIYFGSITAQLKAAVDRFQNAWVAKYVLKQAPETHKVKNGALILVSGSDNSRSFENAKQIISKFFATLDIEYYDQLFIGGSDMPGEGASRKDDIMKRAAEVGAKLARSF